MATRRRRRKRRKTRRKRGRGPELNSLLRHKGQRRGTHSSKPPGRRASPGNVARLERHKTPPTPPPQPQPARRFVHVPGRPPRRLVPGDPPPIDVQATERTYAAQLGAPRVGVQRARRERAMAKKAQKARKKARGALGDQRVKDGLPRRPLQPGTRPKLFAGPQKDWDAMTYDKKRVWYQGQKERARHAASFKTRHIAKSCNLLKRPRDKATVSTIIPKIGKVPIGSYWTWGFVPEGEGFIKGARVDMFGYHNTHLCKRKPGTKNEWETISENPKEPICVIDSDPSPAARDRKWTPSRTNWDDPNIRGHLIVKDDRFRTSAAPRTPNNPKTFEDLGLHTVAECANETNNRLADVYRYLHDGANKHPDSARWVAAKQGYLSEPPKATAPHALRRLRAIRARPASPGGAGPGALVGGAGGGRRRKTRGKRRRLRHRTRRRTGRCKRKHL